jgi:hypothetical protein
MAEEGRRQGALIGAEAHRASPSPASGDLLKDLISRREATQRRLNEGIADANATGRRFIKGRERSNALLSIEDYEA